MVAKLPYTVEDGLLYSVQEDGSYWLYVLKSLRKDIFQLIHDD